MFYIPQRKSFLNYWYSEVIVSFNLKNINEMILMIKVYCLKVSASRPYCTVLPCMSYRWLPLFSAVGLNQRMYHFLHHSSLSFTVSQSPFLQIFCLVSELLSAFYPSHSSLKHCDLINGSPIHSDIEAQHCKCFQFCSCCGNLNPRCLFF